MPATTRRNSWVTANKPRLFAIGGLLLCGQLRQPRVGGLPRRTFSAS